MKKVLMAIPQIYKWIASMIFCAILMWLIFLGVRSTSYMPADIMEATYFVTDNIFVNVLSVVLFAMGICVIKRWKVSSRVGEKLEFDNKLFSVCKGVGVVLIFGIALTWVLTTQFIPTDDQACIVAAVTGLRTGDYGMFTQTGYISINPNQIGLVFWGYLFSFLFGIGNYVMFQVFNAVGVTIVYWMMSEVAETFGIKRVGQLLVLVIGIMFCPLWMYCSFVYGNVMGLACSLVAIKHEIRFFEKFRLKDAIIAAVAIMLAVMLKNNYLISLVAMIIYASIEWIRKQKKKCIVLIALIVVCFVLQAKGTVAIIEQKTGHVLNQGESAWSYVVMGLQGTGWFNGYNVDSYVESGYNTAAQAEMAKTEIKRAVMNFLAHKREAVSFFTKKIASEWNNPTFQGFWIVQVLSSRVELSPFATWFVGVGGMDMYATVLNVFQIVILVGALCYCLFGLREKQYYNALLFIITFVGGFLFHIIWEAKCQYTITYFVLLFPLAIKGYGILCDEILGMIGERKNCEEKNRQEKRVTLSELIPMGVLFAAVVMAFCVLYGNGHWMYLGKDTLIYRNYAAANGSTKVLEEGVYRFHTKDGYDFVAYSPDGAAITVVPANEGIPEETILWVRNVYTTSWGAFNYEEAGKEQPWVIKFVDEDTVCILYARITSRALTYDSLNRSVSLDKYTGAENQLWSVEKIR